jgi:TonB family protein
VFTTETYRNRCRRRPSPALRTIVVICLSFLTASVTPDLHAQKIEKADRKLIRKVTPDYPWDLKRAYIGGMVRLDVVVSPGGSVDTISVVGGNPILAECAVKAVKKWKYTPADSETNVRVNVAFDPHR